MVSVDVNPFTAPACNFSGLKEARAHAHSIYSGPLTHLLSMLRALMQLFHVPVQKRRQKSSRVSYLVLLLVVFKWHHGSEGVKHHGYLLCVGRIVPNMSAWHLKTLSPTSLRVVQGVKRRSSNQSWNDRTSSKTLGDQKQCGTVQQSSKSAVQ